MEALQKIVEEVKEMRRLQQEYWETKNFTLITKIKRQEKYVDRLIFELNNNG